MQLQSLKLSVGDPQKANAAKTPAQGNTGVNKGADQNSIFGGAGGGGNKNSILGLGLIGAGIGLMGLDSIGGPGGNPAGAGPGANPAGAGPGANPAGAGPGANPAGAGLGGNPAATLTANVNAQPGGAAAGAGADPVAAAGAGAGAGADPVAAGGAAAGAGAAASADPAAGADAGSNAADGGGGLGKLLEFLSKISELLGGKKGADKTGNPKQDTKNPSENNLGNGDKNDKTKNDGKTKKGKGDDTSIIMMLIMELMKGEKTD